MQNKRVFRSAVMIFAVLVSNRAVARAYPAGFSIFAPSQNVFWQAPAPESSVCGIRFGLIRSLNDSVCGLDLGLLVSESKEKFSGMALSGFANLTDGDQKIYLLQFAGMFNSARGAKIWGLQLAGGANEIRDDGHIVGIQASLIWNQARKTNITGLQIAAVNRAARVKGIQLGTMQYCRKPRLVFKSGSSTLIWRRVRSIFCQDSISGFDPSGRT